VILFVDTETFCTTPIRSGTHRYAEDVEVMIESWAIDDGAVIVSDRTAGEPGPFDLYDPKDFEWIVMHRSAFDRIVYRSALGVVIDPAQIWDTEVQARAHGLPGGLDKLCGIFQVPEGMAKHKDGKPLIQLFCKPRPKNSALRRATSETHPIEWGRFKGYAGGDIHSMRYIKNVLPHWNYPDREHGLWQLDQKINDRGFAVDLELARSAINAIGKVKKHVDQATQAITDDRLRSTTQRDRLMEELLMEYGVLLPDMQSTTIERRLEDPDLPEAVKELLGQRLMTSVTSTAKYNRILDAVSSDGRLRGSVRFCGAPRTKRDAGEIFQPQNLPRPDMKPDDIEDGIAMLKAGCAHLLMDEPDVVRLTWNALRGLIVAGKDKKIVQGDLAQIEARVLPWLAGEEWKLQAFKDYDTITGYDMLGDPIRAGPDLYLIGAARILGKMIEEIDRYLRQAYGKVPELACGYGGGIGAFTKMAQLYNLDLPEHEMDEIVRGWRASHPAIASWNDGLWVKLEQAATKAIQMPGVTFEAGEHIRFERWKNWLRMELPSGGFLSYAAPALAPHPKTEQLSPSFMGINSYTKRWERIFTYGGKLAADATQATAREIFAYNWRHVEDLGFPIVLRVHDELVTEPLDDPNFSVNKLMEAMTRRPPWIDDRLPLAAGGFEAQRYRKDD
jgi:DNA polymerase